MEKQDGKVEVELELDEDVIELINERAMRLGQSVDETVEEILKFVIDAEEETWKN